MLLLNEQCNTDTQYNMQQRLLLEQRKTHFLTVSLGLISGLDFVTTSIRAKRDMSFCSSTILSPAVSFTFLTAVLHVFSCFFFQ